MNRLIILFITLFLTASANAQHRTSHNPKQNETRSKQLLMQLLHKQDAGNRPQAKTTATSQRLIAQSDYNYAPYAIYDSFSFIYNTTARGSVFDLDFLGYHWGAGPSFIAFIDLLGFVNTSGLQLPHNNGLWVACDTTKKWSLLPTPPYTFGAFATESHSYDAANNLIDETYLGEPGIIKQRNIMTYNSLSNITSVIEMDDFSGTAPALWDTSYLSNFTYNTANKIAVDSQSEYNISTHSWEPMSKFVYNYDGADNMILGQGYYWNYPGWVLSSTYTMTYTSANKIKTYKYDANPATSSYTGYIDSFGYTTGVDYYTYNRHKEYLSDMITDMNVTTKNVNAASMPDTVYTYSYASDSTTLINSSMNVFAYNSYNNPINATTYSDPGAASPVTPTVKTWYYYEMYEASGLTSTTALPIDIKVYPNPTTNLLNIDLSESAGNQTLSVAITDINGRKIRTETFYGSNNTYQISTENLLPGMYVVTIHDKAGRVMHTKKIMKL